MMEQEYRREMDRVELSPDQRARIVQAMVEESPRKKRRRPPMRLRCAHHLGPGPVPHPAGLSGPGSGQLHLLQPGAGGGRGSGR